GLPRVDLSLVATAVPLPPNVPEIPPPTLRESIEQAFRAASVAADPSERVSLLQSIVGSVAPEAGKRSEKGSWTSLVHSRAAAALSRELKIDTTARTLSSRTST